MPPAVAPLAAADPDLALVGRWADDLGALVGRVAPAFARGESRGRALASLRGLLGPVARKHGWPLAEAAGDATPYGVQHLLGRAVWDADAVRDAVRDYVVDHLGAPDATLVSDETGFLKKGRRSVGVPRQYSGTAGRIENCQVGVFLAYASPHGQAFLDRALYLPKEWTPDPTRCRVAGVPATAGFRTKPQLARTMLARALDAGVPAGWVTGDEVYGSDRPLRVWLEERDVAHVLAVKRTEPLWAATARGPAQVAAGDLVAALPADGWAPLSAGAGAKGPRRYDWARLAIRPLPAPAKGYWLLARRSLADPADLAYYVCFGAADTPLAELVGVAGRRWTIEEGFAAAKGEVGLDQYEVRRGGGWHRHITLALAAHAFLAVTRAGAAAAVPASTPPLPPPRRGSLARFRRHRGLASG